MMKLKLWMLLVFGIICLLCLRCLNWYFVLFVRVVSVFKRSQEFYDLSRDFNCIIDVFSVVELKMCVLVHLVR